MEGLVGSVGVRKGAPPFMNTSPQRKLNISFKPCRLTGHLLKKKDVLFRTVMHVNLGNLDHMQGPAYRKQSLLPVGGAQEGQPCRQKECWMLRTGEMSENECPVGLESQYSKRGMFGGRRQCWMHEEKLCALQ